MYKKIHGLLDFPCDTDCAAPHPALGFEVIPVMRSAFESSRSGTKWQERLWRHSNSDWMHDGSPSSQKSPPKPVSLPNAAIVVLVFATP